MAGRYKTEIVSEPGEKHAVAVVQLTDLGARLAAKALVSASRLGDRLCRAFPPYAWKNSAPSLASPCLFLSERFGDKRRFVAELRRAGRDHAGRQVQLVEDSPHSYDEVTMPDPVADAAREWLIRVVDMYEGIDTGPSDPIHAARMRAKKMLNAGPTSSDPLLIAGMIAEALPGDDRAAKLALSWSDKYLEAVRRPVPSVRR